MILRRVIEHFRKQEWTAIFLDFVIVVVGVFIGIQVSNWNDARAEELRRRQIIAALVTNLSDSINVQKRFAGAIGEGLAEWRRAFEAGEQPAPFYYRIDGSDTAPDVWSTFVQMELTELFDPATLFDLSFYYSEQVGVGRKYLRYVTFIENEILPREIGGAEGFYDGDGHVLPQMQANMDRLRDFQRETERMTAWATCLIYRLEANRTFEETCRRAGFLLPGMAPPEGKRE